MVLDRYGLQADQASIYIFVAIVPVTIDACFKLWVRLLNHMSAFDGAVLSHAKEN